MIDFYAISANFSRCVCGLFHFHFGVLVYPFFKYSTLFFFQVSQYFFVVYSHTLSTIFSESVFVHFLTTVFQNLISPAASLQAYQPVASETHRREQRGSRNVQVVSVLPFPFYSYCSLFSITSVQLPLLILEKIISERAGAGAM